MYNTDMQRKYHIQPGDTFSRLTAVRLDHVGKHHRSYFLFRCACGREKVILGSGVISGNTKSCGCLAREIRKSKRLPGNHGEITAVILGYKRHAERRGFKFLLDRASVERIIRENCFYCGIKPQNIKITKNSMEEGFAYNGIDRVDSTKDYIIDNVVPCCDFCNKSKGNKTKEEFLSWIDRVHNYQAMVLHWG